FRGYCFIWIAVFNFGDFDFYAGSFVFGVTVGGTLSQEMSNEKLFSRIEKVK
ncbi:hypothetical protein THIOM_002376, partial [Candidatus Thiomargarita nelsonii]